MGVVDRPDIVLVVEFDFAPLCKGFIAQRGLDGGPLFGTWRSVCEYSPGNKIPIAKARPNTICAQRSAYDGSASHKASKRRQAWSVSGDMLGIGRSGYPFHQNRAGARPQHLDASMHASAWMSRCYHANEI
jgi:hypothetical protein